MSILMCMTASLDTRELVEPLRFGHPVQPTARVLHQIRTLPNATRVLLRDTLGYSQPSVTRHVRSLIDARLVEEVPAQSSDDRVGRPQASLRIDARHIVTWGAHVGARTTTVLAADGAGRVIREETIDMAMGEQTPDRAITRLAAEMVGVGRGLPRPTTVGVAFSEHVDHTGRITSPTYGWDDVAPGPLLSAALGLPVSVTAGVSAMAGTELAAAPISHREPASALYFYAREVVNHAWIINGTVHRAHSGRTPVHLRPTAPDGIHPLGNAAVVQAARELGSRADSFSSLMEEAATQPRLRQLLDTRIDHLARAVSLALEIIDPERLVLAGDAFHLDRVGLRRLVSRVHADWGSGRRVKISLAGPHVTRDAARVAGLHSFWADPLACVTN